MRPGIFWSGCTCETVYAYDIEGGVLDIGNRESLAEARAFFQSTDS